MSEEIPSGAVLVVDDEPEIRSTLRRFLERYGHRVETVGSVPDALERLVNASYDVVITDLRMPGTSGLDLLAEVHSHSPGTRTILMSGRADAADAAVAIERGVDRLLLKPFDLDELRSGVESALTERRLHVRAAEERVLLDALVRERENASKLLILRAAHALAAAVEAKDAYTRGHSTRVTAYSMAIAEVVGAVEMPSFRLAGDLHDVGKIGVPDAVLNKPGKLSEEEFALIRRHPEVGARILDPLIDDPLVLGVVRWHHERWNGGGYPDGLGGEDIPLAARILAVGDTLDAMTSSRAYRTGLPWQVAVEEIRRCAGSQFDPRVVEAFEEALPRLTALQGSFAARDRAA